MRRIISFITMIVLAVSLTGCLNVSQSTSRSAAESNKNSYILNIHLTNYETEFNTDFPCDLYAYLDDIQIAIIPFGEAKCIKDLNVTEGTHILRISKENDPAIEAIHAIIVSEDNSTFYSEVANQRYNMVLTNVEYIDDAVSHEECS